MFFTNYAKAHVALSELNSPDLLGEMNNDIVDGGYVEKSRWQVISGWLNNDTEDCSVTLETRQLCIVDDHHGHDDHDHDDHHDDHHGHDGHHANKHDSHHLDTHHDDHHNDVKKHH